MKGRVRNWRYSQEGDPHFIGFAAFKAGMSHVAYVENDQLSPIKGKERMSAVTVLDAPPLVLFALKVYRRDEYGLHSVGTVFADRTGLKRELVRKIRLPGENYDWEAKMQELQGKLKPGMLIRGVFHTQPNITPVPRIKPDIIEIPVDGGSTQDQWDFVKNQLGKEIRVRDVIEEGELLDVIAVSKGKGFQGPVKIFGIKMLPRKDRKGMRRVGSIGPWRPGDTMYTVARAGQCGLHNRTEYHKRVLKITENAEELNPRGGFIRYGLVRGDGMVVMGSVPGPKKRLIRLRKSIRKVRAMKLDTPEITYYSRQSQQR